MEVLTHENNMEQGQPPRRRQKGGLITMPFIIANEALERMATFGLLPNMILYLMDDYHLGISQGTNILFLWSAATNFFPIVGALISDSYLGRFLTIALGLMFSLLGLVLLWLTAMVPQARPPYCDRQYKQICKHPTGSQYAILLSSFMLMSIGAGGIRACSLSFGADQLDKKNNPNNKRVLEKYFSWYYTAVVLAALFAFTAIVYIQVTAGWKVGFLVPVILMVLSAVLFFVASPLYIKKKADMSLLTNLARVIVVCIKNRKVAFPSEISTLKYHHTSDTTVSKPSNKLRFLNKACIIRNPEDITPEGEASKTWRLCTVEQVEGLKVLIRVMPLWSSTIMVSINFSQGTFQLLQAQSMNRHITPRFQIPAGSFTLFGIMGAVIWIVLYDRIIIPLTSKIRGKPFSIGVKVRIGAGIFCSFLAMTVAAIVEHFRRRKAIESGLYNNRGGVVNMSAMLLIPQHVLTGMAEALTVIASNEFFYCELPKKMSSIAVSLSGLGLAIGSLLASLILNTVNNVTKSGGKEGWITSNINQGHYESYYWLLAVMSSVNLLYFLLCSWAYGPCADQGISELQDEGKDDKDLAQGRKEEETHVVIGNGGKNGEEKSEGDGV